jgi:hypothetical protein
MKPIPIIVGLAVVVTTALACSNGDFSGNSGQISPAKKKVPNIKTETPQPPAGDNGLKTDDGREIITPNLTTCAQLPLAGKITDGRCEANSVVVIVDDGSSSSGGLTCCPIGNNVLSAKPEEQHVSRNECGANEVATGISRPSIFCTKINTDLFKLEAPTSSILLNPLTSITALEQSIAASYANFDACVCRAPSVVIGPHSQDNDTCAEKCSVITRLQSGTPD